MSAPLRESSGAWYALWAAAVLAAIAIPISGDIGGMQDGDGILTALISTQKLTWYFWGQDRLLNFIPALAYPVTDLEWNLRLQLFLRALFAFLAPAGILCLLTDSRAKLAIATIVTNALLMLALSKYGAFNLYVQHNPFASSLVLLWLANQLWRDGRWPAMAVAFTVLCIAYATNLALIVVAAPLIAIVFLAGRSPRREMFFFGITNVVAVVTSVVHGRIFGEHNTQLGVALHLSAIKDGYLAVAHEVAWPWLLAYAAIAIAASFAARISQRWLISTSIVGSILLIGILSLSAWAQLNGFNIRYYLVFVIAVTAASSLCLADLLSLPTKHPALTGWLVAALPLFSFFAGLGGLSRTPGALLTHPWREEAPIAAKTAIDANTPLIIGGFWDVWSTVYQASVTTHSTSFFGAAQRGHVLRATVRDSADRQGRIRALCFLDTPEDCAAAASQSLRALMIFDGGAFAEAPSPPGKPLHVLTLRFADPGPTLPVESSFGQPVVKAADAKAVMTMTTPGTLDVANDQIHFTVLLRNDSSMPMTSFGVHPINLGVRLAGGDGKVENANFVRAMLPVIQPGQIGHVSVVVPAKVVTGHALSMIPVQEGIGWFDQYGVKPLIVGPFSACGAHMCDATGLQLPEMDARPTYQK